MIKIDNTFKLHNVQSNIIMKVDSQFNTLAVLGVINSRPTTEDREDPPKCGNGFQTADLPFAKGHVIALELGGSDDPYNVVPQFQGWQGWGDGPWRKMEKELHSEMKDKPLMLVEIGYGRKGLKETPGSAKKAFLNNSLREWCDPRIPDSFAISVWKCDSAKLLKAIKDDQDFNKTITDLKKSKPKFKRDFNLGVELPQPDRQYWLLNGAVGIARELLKEQNGKLKKQESFATAFLQGDLLETVRNELAGYDGVQATEAKGIQAQPLIARHQEGPTSTEAQVWLKWRNLKAADKEVIPEKDLGFKRTAQFDNSAKKTKISHTAN